MTQQITVSKNTLKYVMEQCLVKGISLGKKGVDQDIESVIESLSQQFTNDVEKFSYAKQRF